jgi:hypothetical protein
MQVTAVSPDPIVLRLPAAVVGLAIRGDEQARRSVRALVVEPASLIAPAERLSTAPARRAVSYETATVFFLDDRSFPEPDAFWTGGARDTSVVVQPEPGRRAVTLLLRNAPVENRVTISSGGRRDTLTLAAGEERRIDIPVDPQRGAALIEFSVASGFRPSEVDATSNDHRYLGVWVRVL